VQGCIICSLLDSFEICLSIVFFIFSLRLLKVLSIILIYSYYVIQLYFIILFLNMLICKFLTSSLGFRAFTRHNKI